MADVPLPGSWIKKEEPKPVVKRPFVRKPHLTDKPFNNDNLKALRKSMGKKRSK